MGRRDLLAVSAVSGEPAATPALDVAGVTHFYGPRRALEDVSFRAETGKFTLLLGLNGAGKSTLFSLITHLYACRKGAIRIFGHDVARESGAALTMLGVAFQQRTLDPDLTVAQNLIYHAALHGIGPKEARPRIAAALARIGLADRARDKARHLSGGQSRRVEIARSLLHRPRLLLLDEPTAGLDLSSRADILKVVRELVSEDGVSVLWTTHLVDEARADDPVVVLHKGRILAKESVASLVARLGAKGLGDAFTGMTRDNEPEAA